MENLIIYGLSDSISFCEAQGIAKVMQAYADNCPGEYIMEIFFNDNSGFVYIALENGISIRSQFGMDVQYLVTDFDNGEEWFYDTYDEAEVKLYYLNNQ